MIPKATYTFVFFAILVVSSIVTALALLGLFLAIESGGDGLRFMILFASISAAITSFLIYAYRRWF